MKILHITKKYPNALGGDATVVANLEKQQWKNGHKVAVLTSNCAEIKHKSNVYKFGLKDTPANLDNITPRRLLSLGHLFFKSFSVIRKERPDVIHSHSIDMAFAASLAARIYRVPMVHTFHIVTTNDKNQSWLRRTSELFFKRGANPKLVTAPDEADVKRLKAAGVKNAELLPNGIDLKFWRREGHVKNEIFTFIAVGRLEEQKGYEYLIKATARLKQMTSHKFKVIIVGDGSMAQELGIQAMDADVLDHLEFVGRKSAEEVRALYESADAVVSPSLWEAASLTVYEAWAMKLPVITTRAGIFQEEDADSDRVEIVKMRSPESLADGMLNLLINKERRHDLATAGYKIAQAHAWDKIYDAASAIYAKALAPKEKKQKVVAPVVAAPAAVVAAPKPVVTAPIPKQVKERKPFKLNELRIMLGLTVASLAILGAASVLSGTINALATLPLAVIVPGLLFRFAAFRDMAGKSLAATIPIAGALGLLLITLESLALNWALPLFGVDDPLRNIYVVPAHMLLTLMLLAIYVQKQGKVARDAMVKLHISFMQVVQFVVPLALPLLAAAGAYRLNNGFGNELSIVAMITMGVFATWFVIKPKAFNPMWLLFNIALGLLLTTSLRSWYVSGFDISQEFQVFNLTLQNLHWDLSAIPGNAYNACLSLTTLPTALQQMIGITPELIFKFFYQIVFGLTAVVIYLLGRRFADTRGAFLVGLFFVAQAQFVGTMPAIVRQELGLLFFALIIFLLIEKAKMTRARAMLLGLLGLGMVFSHYSTVYVTIFILAATAFLLWVSRLAFVRKRLPEFKPVLSFKRVGLMALALLAMAFVWYSVINRSSSNLSSTVAATWRNITSYDLKFTTDHSLSNIDKNGYRTQILLGGDRESARAADVAAYKDANNIEQDIKPASVPKLEAKNEAAVWTADKVRDIISITLKILLPISPFLLLLFKKTRTQVADVSFLGLGVMLMFVSYVFLPTLAYSYNLERVWQQALIITSLTGLWAFWFMLPNKRKLNTILTSVLVLLFFAFTPGTGVINQLIGGTSPRMNMNNMGEEYSKYYTHESEVKSAEWLRDNCAGEDIYADRYATLRVTAYAGVNYDDISSDILKADDGCLLLDSANTQDDLYYASYKKRPVRYTIPDSVFDKGNLLYSNGSSEVYSY
jgi:uncharacterized membrane protein/glycosyltransferase involved in cell wall biosynthesis